MKEINRNISRNISNYMDTLNVTQTELSKLLDCSNTTISMWIQGNSTPRMDKIDKMCEIFHCTRQDLLRDTPKTKEEIEEDQIIASFAKMFKEFDAEHRLRVIAYMQKLGEDNEKKV